MTEKGLTSFEPNSRCFGCGKYCEPINKGQLLIGGKVYFVQGEMPADCQNVPADNCVYKARKLALGGDN